MNDQQIIEKLGIGNLPKEIQDETLRTVNHVVELRVMGLLDDLMSDDQRTALEVKTKEGSDAVWQWLKEEFADVDKLYAAALSDYLEEKTQQVTS
ncbi:MAG: hypothetical protein U0520_01640 [Candidatus Saccharimonadales bacterium]